MSKIVKTKNTETPADTALLGEIRGMTELARDFVAQTANSTLTMLYWKIGERIRRVVLQTSRAEYGKKIVATLSQQLEPLYGRGFNHSALTRMIKFADIFPDEKIVVSLVRQLKWTMTRTK